MSAKTVRALLAALCAAVPLAVLCWSSGSAAAASCLSDTRNVRFGTAAVKLAGHRCDIGQQRLRISTFRLSEGHAGGLIMGEPMAETSALVGNVRLVQNAVYAEARQLFETYGIRFQNFDRESDFQSMLWGVSAGDNATRLTGDPFEDGERTIWYLTPPNPSLSSDVIFLAAPHKVALETDIWPEGFRHYYEECGALDGSNWNPISCIVLWRYAQGDELDSITTQSKEWAEKIDREIREAIAGSDEPELPPQDYQKFTSMERHFGLFRRLTRNGWPSDFLAVASEHGCGTLFESFRYFPRPLALDVVLIENQSSAPVTISHLLGHETRDMTLRAASDGRNDQPTWVDHPAIVIAPREKVAVPIRMAFLDGTGQREPKYDMNDRLRNPWSSAAEASAVYAKIRSHPAGTVFKFDGSLWGEGEEEEAESTGAVIRKTRESFLPPTLPTVSDYIYGPEYGISGLRIGDATLMLNKQQPNPMDMTVASSGASCPFLYSWDPAVGMWTLHGKVIDDAREKSKKMTEVVSVPRGVLRFKLAEEEPEISYIDAVELRITLDDGRALTLHPRQEQLAAVDEQYLRILPYRSEVMDFALPDGIAEREVARAELAITGYYRRASSFLSALARAQ